VKTLVRSQLLNNFNTLINNKLQANLLNAKSYLNQLIINELIFLDDKTAGKIRKTQLDTNLLLEQVIKQF
jgi:hypothetical protein